METATTSSSARYEDILDPTITKEQYTRRLTPLKILSKVQAGLTNMLVIIAMYDINTHPYYTQQKSISGLGASSKSQ